MSKKFGDVKVDLKTIVLLSAEGKQNLISFTETEINKIDFAAYIEEVHSHVYEHHLKAPYRNVEIVYLDVAPHDA